MTPPKRALAWTAAALYGLPALLGAVAGDLATGLGSGPSANTS